MTLEERNMMEEQKKEYTAPELTVVEMGYQVQPLCSSCPEEGCSLEMGFAPTMSNDHLA